MIGSGVRADHAVNRLEPVVDPDVIDLAVRTPRRPRATAYGASSGPQHRTDRWPPHVAVTHDYRRYRSFAQYPIERGELRETAPEAVRCVNAADRDGGVAALDLGDDRTALRDDISRGAGQRHVGEGSHRQA